MASIRSHGPGKQAQEGTTSNRLATPGMKAPVFCSEATATEGWYFSADLGLWLGTSASPSECPSESVELKNVGVEREG